MNHEPTLTPEESILFLASRINLGPDESFQMHDILKNNPDWSIIDRYATLVGIKPLLFKHLSQNGNKNHVPAEVMSTLKKHYMMTLVRNMVIYKGIDEILNVMNKAEIPIVLLKGAYLANYIYADIGLRQMSDVDVLVREEDKEFVLEKLKEIDFKKPDGRYASDFHENHLADKVCHLAPMVKQKMCPVELHFDVFSSFKYTLADMAKVWQTVGTTSLHGLQIRYLSLEYQLLHLCLHLYNHVVPSRKASIAFYWFCDIHELIINSKKEINWNKYCKITDQFNVVSQTNLILAYIKFYWNTPVPESVFRDTGKNIDIFSITNIVRSVLDGSKSKRKHIHHYIRKTRILLDNDKNLNMLYYLWKEIVPMRSYLVFRYNIKNRSFVYFYYIIHPCKLLVRAVTSIFFHIIYFIKENIKKT